MTALILSCVVFAAFVFGAAFAMSVNRVQRDRMAGERDDAVKARDAAVLRNSELNRILSDRLWDASNEPVAREDALQADRVRAGESLNDVATGASAPHGSR